MKKIIILSIAILSVFACSSHEDELFTAKELKAQKPITSTIDETEIKEILKGTWTLVSTIENGDDKATPCTKKNSIVFYPSGNFFDLSYEAVAGKCTSKYYFKNKWIYTGGNNLILKFGHQKSLNFKLMGMESNIESDYVLQEVAADDKLLKDTKTYRKGQPETSEAPEIVEEPEISDQPETSEAPEIVEEPETSDQPETPIIAEDEIKNETQIKNILKGIWVLDSNLENEVDTSTPCTKKSKIVLYPSGSFIDLSYEEVNGDCRMKSSFKNKWIYTGGNNLTLKFGNQKSLNFRLMAIKISNTEHDYILKQTAEDGKPLKEIKTYKEKTT